MPYTINIFNPATVYKAVVKSVNALIAAAGMLPAKPNYRQTPPINWRECGPRGVIGQAQRKSLEAQEAKADRNGLSVTGSAPEPTITCKVCGRPLLSSEPRATIHIECEEAATQLLAKSFAPRKR